jgi:hypothetical protein
MLKVAVQALQQYTILCRHFFFAFTTFILRLFSRFLIVIIIIIIVIIILIA